MKDVAEYEDLVLLEYEDIPRHFTLTIDTETDFPCIRIYNDILQSIREFPPDIIESIQKNLNLDKERFPYTKISDGVFGFGLLLEPIEKTDDQTTFRLNLPVVHKLSSEDCAECSGSGYNKVLRMECLKCFGSGKSSIIEWCEVYALLTSVAMLFERLEHCFDKKRKIQTDEKQLLSLIQRVDYGTHGSSIGGKFSPYFINFLKSFGENYRWQHVSDLVFSTYEHMWIPENPRKDKSFGRMRTGAYQSLPGNLMIDVPGDACGIHPSPHVEKICDDQGIKFTCHNVDNPMQALSILTGLAAMCDLCDAS
jgi:hypothetical protein